jgi:Uma2 family endonuclease
MVTVAHPHIEPAEYVALQTRAGWQMDIELIDGEAVVMPPTGDYASSVQGELFFALRHWQEDCADEGLLLQDVFVAFPGERYLAPDIAWWSAGRRPVLGGGAVDAVPDLVVEVLSPSTRENDLGIKRKLYLGSGVRELWLADPEARSVTQVRLNEGGDRLHVEGDFLRSDLLDDFALNLERVFRLL